MKKHIKYLMQQKEKAEKEFEEAKNKLNTWTEALKLAQEEEDIEKEDIEEEHVLRFKGRRVGRSGPTIKDLAENVLREHGPLFVGDILIKIKEKGRDTNVNSLSVQLHRGKPERFDKDDEGRWYAVQQKE